jgi:hypothetical protein
MRKTWNARDFNRLATTLVPSRKFGNWKIVGALSYMPKVRYIVLLCWLYFNYGIAASYVWGFFLSKIHKFSFLFVCILQFQNENLLTQHLKLIIKKIIWRHLQKSKPQYNNCTISNEKGRQLFVNSLYKRGC